MRERRGWEEDEEEEDDGENGVEGGVGAGEEEEDVGTFNLTISPCLRRGARLGRMSPAASSPTNCDAEELQPDFVASLAGILVLTGDAREGLVCLEGKVVAIHLEEETNSTCPSPKAWCSDYGSK